MLNQSRRNPDDSFIQTNLFCHLRRILTACPPQNIVEFIIHIAIRGCEFHHFNRIFSFNNRKLLIRLETRREAKHQN